MQEFRDRLHQHIEKYLPSCVEKYVDYSSSDASEHPPSVRECLLQQQQRMHSERLVSVHEASRVIERGGGYGVDGAGGRRATLVGKMASNELGDLTIEDNTARTKCQVLVSRCGDHVQLGEVVLIKEWQYIPPSKRSSGYLEVMDIEQLGGSTAMPCPELDDLYCIASLKHSIKTKSLPSRANLNVAAVVSAVGEVLKNGPGGCCTFAVELRDVSDPLECYGVLVQTPSLLHMSKLLVLHEIYLFTELRDMLMNKGACSEMRVLATTAHSTIHPYNHTFSQCQPPHSKRMRRDCKSCDIPLAQAKSHDMPLPHSANSDFISYKGILTDCILPEAGLYRLDNSVLLYMYDRSCVDGGCGLRPGALIKLYNVHALKLPSHLLYASGFYCCARSLVCVSQFSKESDSFKPFLPQNKLAKLLRKYSPKDVAYILHTFLTFKESYGLETSFTVIKELTKIAGISPLDKDVMAEFFSNPHNCPFTQTRDHHGNHPMVADSLGNFVKAVEQRISVGGVKWSGLERQLVPAIADSAVSVLQVGHEERVQWSYAVLSSWDAPAQVLIGRLECCTKTGYLTLTDSSTSIPLSPVVPSTTQQQSSTHTNPNLPLNTVIGSTVLLSGVTVYLEKKTPAFMSNDSNPVSPPLIYINASLCTPIVNATVEEGDSARTNRRLYFRVINKNCVVVRPQSLMFTAHTMMGESYEMLKEKREEDNEDGPPVEIALCFTEEAFKWYSYIINGGIYSLHSCKQLPSLEELAGAGFLQVTSDIKLEYIGYSLPQQVIYDTTDLIDTATLPGFMRSKDNDQQGSLSTDHELFSLRGVVISHEYRVHSSTLLAPPTTASSAAPIGQQNCDIILALRVQSSTYPDSIMLYYRLKAGQPHPLGLLPGSVATFHSLLRRTSKNGNVYCESTASSSISLHSLNTIPPGSTHHKSTSDLTPQLLSLPSLYLGDVMQSLLIGRLTARIICVQCRLTSVQWVSLQYKCQGCGCTIVDAVCMSACPHHRPTLKAEARFILDDGSGESHLYASDDMVREVMGVAHKEWAELKEIVIKIGHLTYTRSSLEQQQDVSARLLTAESRGKALMANLASRPSLHRALKIYCQPFVSSTELQECVLGRKQQLRRGFNTLSLPRLQLRAVAILELTRGANTGVCSTVTKQMLNKLEQLKIKSS